VAVTPFHDIPKKIFLSRMVQPCLGLLFFLIMLVGVVANSSDFQEGSRPTAVAPFWIAAFRHYGQVFSNLSQMPGVCWSGNTVNDFQAHQCETYWTSLSKSGVLALSPFLVVAMLLYVSLENLTSLYKRTQKKAEKGNAAFGGTVTHPAQGPPDVFSWFYCFRPIMIELPNKAQVKVYVPLEVPVPNPGEILAVFEGTVVFGEKRHLAMLYAPHVAVVRGE